MQNTTLTQQWLDRWQYFPQILRLPQERHRLRWTTSSVIDVGDEDVKNAVKQVREGRASSLQATRRKTYRG